MKTAVIIKGNISNAKLIAEYLAEKYINVLQCASNMDVMVRQVISRSDIVIVDKYLPGELDGLEIARNIKMKSPRTYCIVCLPPDCFRSDLMLRYDINAYLSTEHSLTDLVTCIETIQEGYRYVCPVISSCIQAAGLHAGEVSEKEHDLSEQEMKVLQLMLSGLTAKDIAGKLYISVNTLHNHKTNIKNKLKLHSNRELLVFALKHNIISIRQAVAV